MPRCLDCLAAISIFFIAAILIFHRRVIDFFIAAISIFFSSPRYRFFSSPRHRFFFVAISIFFAPSRRYSFSLTVVPPSGAVLQFLRRRALCNNHRAPTGALQSLLRADGRCSSIFAPTGALCNHYHSALTGAALQFLCRRALNSSFAPPSGVTFKHCAAVGQKF
jgi:hypothetical protein